MTSTDQRLASYLARIGLASAPPADENGLMQVLAAQRHAIAFENLDIPLGRGIAVDIRLGLSPRRRLGGDSDQSSGT